MTLKIGINGLGRIGRCVIRALAEHPRNDIELVAVNGPAPIDQHVHLLKYDSVHGRFRGEVSAEGNDLIINGKRIPLRQEREPEAINWSQYGVDVVFECTGKFTKKPDAARHLGGSVKKVLVSAPAEEADATIVFGVNNEALKPEHTVISVGSCTTNCLAPVAKVLGDNFGIEKGFMTTIHAYTGDQNLVDGSHKDMRRARAAALSMIPSSTGAAKALGLVLPALAGKLDGTSVRVPTANVSMVDLCFTSSKPMTKEAINAAMKAASSTVLAYEDAPLVSIDFTHHPASSIFDATGTKVIGDRFGRVAAWYDNEWGFSLRMLDVAGLLR
jgi:glyceraldehyde 3-phosphate dehydrogenase